MPYSEVARLTLALSLMGAALRLPDRWVKRHVKSLLVVLLAGMPLMWLVSSACAWWILGLPPLESMILGAIGRTTSDARA